MFRALNEQERAAVANLQQRGKALRGLDPARMRVDYSHQGIDGAVTIAMIKKTSAHASVYPGWSKYNLNDRKREHRNRSVLFGDMKAFSRAVQGVTE